MEPQTVIRPTQERFRHDVVFVPERDREHQEDRPARIETQTMLDRYRRRKTLEEHQLAAGEKFAEHTARSGRFPKLAMAWAKPVNGVTKSFHDEQVAAGISRDRAIQHLARSDLSYPFVVEHVCVAGLAAESWAIRNNLHPMKGIKTLRLALDSLAKHYGISETRRA